MKATNECLFCGSRFCYERVVSSQDNGKIYDEVACRSHVKDLHRHSDETAKGVMKFFISGNSIKKRKSPIQ